jgi:hypothetical protein
MFTLDDSFSVDNVYTSQTDFYGKAFFYFFGVIFFFELLRTQISEVELLQLVPGFYFFLFFVSFFLFIFFSDIISRFPTQIDNLKGYGTKMRSRMDLNIIFKFSFFLFSTLLGIILNTVIPLSLDSFNSSSQKTLENTWSLNEVLFVEITLLVILLTMSQIPLFFVFNFNTQNSVNVLSQFWKILVLFITLIAGFLTPTLDGYTQISFAISTFSFYLLIVNILQKRMLLKLNIFLPFG